MLTRRVFSAPSPPAAGTTATQPARGTGATGTRADAWDTVIVGAGVMGAWTAWHLRRRGQRVLLVDAVGPAHARSSSGGESRLTRTIYGADAIYTRMAVESLEDWQWLSGRSGLPVFHRCGALMFFGRREPFVEQSLEVHRRLQMPLEELTRADLERRYPQVHWEGVELGLFEPALGGLMARRAVQTLVQEFVRAGGEYRLAQVLPPNAAEGVVRLGAAQCTDGTVLRATNFVFACGPWLPKVFPDVLGPRIFPTRQEVYFFAPPDGDRRFEPEQLPGWADFNGGDMYYGLPDLESRGFKVAHDAHGPACDPDIGDRLVTPASVATMREYLRRRFPAIAERPLVESRVCQYENSSNGDLLVDRHPRWQDVLLLGAGSGHGFKHGPAIGAHAAALLTDPACAGEPRFALATKGVRQHREVH